MNMMIMMCLLYESYSCKQEPVKRPYGNYVEVKGQEIYNPCDHQSYITPKDKLRDMCAAINLSGVGIK